MEAAARLPVSREPPAAPAYLLIGRNDGESFRGNLNPFALRRELNRLLGGEVASAKIIRSGKILLETATAEQNTALMSITEFAAIPATVEVAVNMSSVQGLVYAPDLALMSNQELLNELAPQYVIEVQRLRSNKDTPNPLIRLRFGLRSLPTRIYCGYSAVKVRTWAPNPKQCKRCYQYGHLDKTCRRRAMCGSCGGVAHGDCHEAISCLHCGGGHPAWDRKCPVWLDAKDELRKAAEDSTYRHDLQAFPPLADIAVTRTSGVSGKQTGPREGSKATQGGAPSAEPPRDEEEGPTETRAVSTAKGDTGVHPAPLPQTAAAVPPQSADPPPPSQVTVVAADAAQPPPSLPPRPPDSNSRDTTYADMVRLGARPRLRPAPYLIPKTPARASPPPSSINSVNDDSDSDSASLPTLADTSESEWTMSPCQESTSEPSVAPLQTQTTTSQSDHQCEKENPLAASPASQPEISMVMTPGDTTVRPASAEPTTEQRRTRSRSRALNK